MGWVFKKGKEGFTLIELILIIFIMGSLSSTAMVKFYDIHQEAEISAESNIVSDVNTGLSIYGTESLVENRNPFFPIRMDEAQLGESSPSNPFFNQVLIHPITNDWEKIAPNRYRGPTGNEYEYDSTNGEFKPTDADIFAQYGNIINQTSLLMAFDSGAIISLNSNLAYIPNLEAKTVEAILASGISVATDGSGGALVTLTDGTTMYVDDILNNYTQITNDYEWSPDNMQFTSNYAYVGYERAMEGNYDINYYRKDNEYDPDTRTRTYNFEYDVSGLYSQVSLDSTNGYISESSYNSDSPYTYSSSRTDFEGGDYVGSYETTYNNSSLNNYARVGERNNYGYTLDSANTGNYEYTYAYNAAGNTYSSTGNGSYSYSYDFELLDGQTSNYSNSYTYNNSYIYNYNTRDYSSSTTYEGENYNYTYSNSYNASTGTYTYTYTNHNTGRSRTQTYKR